MGLVEELREAAEASDLESFRAELIAAVMGRMPPVCGAGELDFAFVCEVGARMSAADEAALPVGCTKNNRSPIFRKIWNTREYFCLPAC